MEVISLIEQEVLKIENKIKELEKECKEWEAYNKCENDILRMEINSLKKYNQSLIEDAKKLGIKFYEVKQETKKVKKPTYKQLAEYLGVSEQAVKQYPKVKRDLMIAGLGQTVETKCNITKDEKQIIANTLFEFVEQNYQDSTRDEEIKKIRSIYKKLYSQIN